jgi:hypothetical protein
VTSRNEIGRLAGKVKRVGDEVMAVITALPPEAQSRCVKQSARLIGVLVKVDAILAETGGKDA